MADQREFPYRDILYEPHHVSPKRAKMSMIERAAQFAPFAALTGYDAAIAETARLTGRKAELDESEMALLNEKLRRLSDLIDRCPRVTVTHYVADLRKDGGSYITDTDYLRKIDPINGTLYLGSSLVIRPEDILSLQCDCLPE